MRLWLLRGGAFSGSYYQGVYLNIYQLVYLWFPAASRAAAAGSLPQTRFMISIDAGEFQVARRRQSHWTFSRCQRWPQRKRKVQRYRRAALCVWQTEKVAPMSELIHNSVENPGCEHAKVTVHFQDIIDNGGSGDDSYTVVEGSQISVCA